MKIALVIPCYNEEAVLNETVRQLLPVAQTLREKHHEMTVYCVDDGSRDATWQVIETLAAEHPFLHGLKLARNAGHQKAVWAGLEYVADKCDAAISIDADLQDDVTAVVAMVDACESGAEVVYGVRRQRTTDTVFKRTTALAFYRLMQAMGVDMVYNHADYRLMTRRVIEALMQYPERNIFLRGMVPLIGFKTAEVYYDRAERFAGESKYPLGKMLNFAVDGITSFSVKPLRLITSLGLLMVILSLFAACYALVSYFLGWTIAGWTSLLLSVWFIGGVQLLCVGVLGEYIGKIYTEVKRRPRYFIEKTI